MDKNEIPQNLDNQRPQDYHHHYTNYFGYPFRGTYEPWYDDRKEYNTNAPSYYDYLAHKNYNHRLIIDLLNRVARRNLTVTDTHSINLTKSNDWISEDDCHNYHDIVDVKADLKLSKKVTQLTAGNKKKVRNDTTVSNALKIFEDGAYTPDYFNFINDLYNLNSDLDDKLDKEINERIKEDNKLNEKINNEKTERLQGDSTLREQLNTLSSENVKLKATLEKLVNNLKESGAWSGGLYDGNFKTGRNIATGNINLFGGTLDGNDFIRTNNGASENDLGGGV